MSNKNYGNKKGHNKRGQGYKPTRNDRGINEQQKDSRQKAGGSVGESSQSFRDIKPDLNDPSWYANTPQLLEDAGRLSFNNPLGGGIEFDFNISVSHPGRTKYWVPGIYAMDIVPFCGVASDATSPINVAATNVYHFTRFANSGARNYEAPDEMLYLMAMDNLYSIYAYMVRAYGVLNLASQWNRYIPKALFESMHLDFDDFQNNIANFRYYINQFGVKMSALAVPNTMPLFLRHQHLFADIYSDGTLSKSSMYLYVPYGFYKFDATASTTGGQLTFVPLTISGTPLTFAQLTAYANAMLDTILYDEDSGIISGDIMKAWGKDRLFKVGLITDDYVVLPQFSGEMLAQIQNATNLSANRSGAGALSSELNITQSGQNLICKPVIPIFEKRATLPLSGRRILNFYKEMPTSADVMVATRLTTSGTVSSSKFTVTEAGTELVVGATMYVMENTGKYTTYNSYYAIDGTNVATLDQLGYLTKFFQHPFAYYYSDGDGTQDLYIPIGDMDNYTMIGRDELEKLHATAILSEFNVPILG